MTPKLAVLFRRDGDNDITAIFPTLPAKPGWVACYTRGGQHTEATLDYVNGDTWPAKPAEYQSLLREVSRIYEAVGNPDRVRLVVRRHVATALRTT